MLKASALCGTAAPAETRASARRTIFGGGGRGDVLLDDKLYRYPRGIFILSRVGSPTFYNIVLRETFVRARPLARAIKRSEKDGGPSIFSRGLQFIAGVCPFRSQSPPIAYRRVYGASDNVWPRWRVSSRERLPGDKSQRIFEHFSFFSLSLSPLASVRITSIPSSAIEYGVRGVAFRYDQSIQRPRPRQRLSLALPIKREDLPPFLPRALRAIILPLIRVI